MSTSAQEAKEKKLKRQLLKGGLKYRTRVFNRCHLTGRTRAYMRRFGVCEFKFRELVLKGLVPGVRKASW